MAEYTPGQFSGKGLPEIGVEGLATLSGPAIARRLRVVRVARQEGFLFLYIAGVDAPLSIWEGRMLKFGRLEHTAFDYLVFVIEQNDLVDAVVRPLKNGSYPLDFYWIHIVYSGTLADAGSFSKKEDGMFAMRTKSGEKAERSVAKLLRDGFGHSFAQEMFDSPGYFELRFDKNKKIRKADRKCLACGLEFEMKKRNRDRKFRLSHSPGRPFDGENRADGWHAFIFPDMKPRFVSNRAISDAIARNEFVPGTDGIDVWADLKGGEKLVCDPPRCPAAVEKQGEPA